MTPGPINLLCAVVIQSRTPEHLRGRVIGSYTSLTSAAGPAGLLAFGPVVDTSGPATGFVGFGGGCLQAGAVAAAGPGLRDLGRRSSHPSLRADAAVRPVA